jgi:hypothetical protein
MLRNGLGTFRLVTNFRFSGTAFKDVDACDWGSKHISDSTVFQMIASDLAVIEPATGG